MKSLLQHYPSGMVSLWFEEVYQERIPVYLLLRQNVHQTRECYEYIVKKERIDTIIFCGFGMNSIMMGDEEGCGNMLHSTINISAAKDIEVNNKMIVTFGLETAARGKVSYNSVMENIAYYTQKRSYLGVSYVAPDDDSFLYFKHCYDFIASQKTHERHKIIESFIT
jgi:hypothetical protein